MLLPIFMTNNVKSKILTTYVGTSYDLLINKPSFFCGDVLLRTGTLYNGHLFHNLYLLAGKHFPLDFRPALVHRLPKVWARRVDSIIP